MQIYFAGSIAGGRNYLETYTKIVKYLLNKGFQINKKNDIRLYLDKVCTIFYFTDF